MSTRAKLWLITIFSVMVLLLVFGFGYGLGLRVTPHGSAFTSVEQAWDIIINDYVEKDKVDVEQLSQAAINGMLQLLDDPYSAYLNPEEYEMSFGDLEGKFEGKHDKLG